MEIMKFILENWHQHLHHLTNHVDEEYNKLQENNKDVVITFDFDDTLSLSHWDNEEDDWVHDGPHLPMIKKYKEYKNDGYKVYIVTSRYQEFLDKDGNWYTLYPHVTPSKKYFSKSQMPIGKFIEEYNLNPDGVLFTDGKLKIETLKHLNSTIHHDDDIEELEAAEKEVIKTVIS